MRQFFIFIKKEFLHVFRDSKTMLLLFGLPVVQILLFGFALTNEIKHSGIVICDQARDPASHALIERISRSPQFDVIDIFSDPDRIEPAFQGANIKLALVFPAGFDRDLHHHGKADMQVIADATDPNTASTLSFYIQGIVGDYLQEINRGPASPVQILPEVRMLYNPELKGATNFVPGVMALILFLVSVLMTSVSIVREKENGTMEILLVSPMHPITVVVAKAIPYFLLSLVNLSVILWMSVYLLDMPFHGSLLLLYAVSAVFILCSLALGLLISNITASQQVAMMIALMGMMLPTVMLSGFMFPLENMPLALQAVANIVPSKWYYIIVKAIMIQGLGLSAILKETLILSGLTGVLFVISFLRFKIRLA